MDFMFCAFFYTCTLGHFMLFCSYLAYVLLHLFIERSFMFWQKWTHTWNRYFIGRGRGSIFIMMFHKYQQLDTIQLPPSCTWVRRRFPKRKRIILHVADNNHHYKATEIVPTSPRLPLPSFPSSFIELVLQLYRSLFGVFEQIYLM